MPKILFFIPGDSMKKYLAFFKEKKSFFQTPDFFWISASTVTACTFFSSVINFHKGEASLFVGCMAATYFFASTIMEAVAFNDYLSGKKKETTQEDASAQPLMLDVKWDFSPIKHKRDLNEEDKQYVLKSAKEVYRNNPTKLIMLEKEIFDNGSVSVYKLKNKIEELEKVGI